MRLLRNTVYMLMCAMVLIVIFNVFLFGHFGYARQQRNDYSFPESGTWHCQELGITLFLDRGICFVSRGDDRISCYLSRERDSSEVYIHCYERNNPEYPPDFLFFSGDFIGIVGDSFRIQEQNSEMVYTFCKIEE